MGTDRDVTYVQTTILGEYYFAEYLQKHPQYKTKPPLPIVPSIYCKQQSKRPYFTISDTQESVESGGASLQPLTIEVPFEGHHIYMDSSIFMSEPEKIKKSSKTMVITVLLNF